MNDTSIIPLQALPGEYETKYRQATSIQHIHQRLLDLDPLSLPESDSIRSTSVDAPPLLLPLVTNHASFTYPIMSSPRSYSSEDRPLDLKVVLNQLVDSGVQDASPLWLVSHPPFSEGFLRRLHPGLNVKIADGATIADGKIGSIILMEKHWVIFDLRMEKSPIPHVMMRIAAPRAWSNLDLLSSLKYYLTYIFLPNTLPTMAAIHKGKSRNFLVPTEDGL